jgi:hypothetical protein
VFQPDGGLSLGTADLGPLTGGSRFFGLPTNLPLLSRVRFIFPAPRFIRSNHSRLLASSLRCSRSHLQRLGSMGFWRRRVLDRVRDLHRQILDDPDFVHGSASRGISTTFCAAFSILNCGSSRWTGPFSSKSTLKICRRRI